MNYSKKLFYVFLILSAFSLYSPAFAVSQLMQEKAAKQAEELGGSYYHPRLEAVIPNYPDIIREEWLRCKNQIAARIGTIDPGPIASSAYWENSAKKTDLLLKDAQIAAPYFKNMCVEVAQKTNTVAHFGFKGKAIVKTKKSLKDKVSQDVRQLDISRKLAVAKIRDALRGTIIAEKPEQIPGVVEKIKEYAVKMDSEVVFTNAWQDERPTGYVGVHAKILFPVVKGKKQDYIIGEIQIHLKCIVDGTENSPKEQQHLIYKHEEAASFDEEMRFASILIYLTGLKELKDN